MQEINGVTEQPLVPGEADFVRTVCGIRAGEWDTSVWARVWVEYQGQLCAQRSFFSFGFESPHPGGIKGGRGQPTMLALTSALRLLLQP